MPFIQWWRHDDGILGDECLHPLSECASERRLELLLRSIVDVAVKATGTLDGALHGERCSHVELAA